MRNLRVGSLAVGLLHASLGATSAQSLEPPSNDPDRVTGKWKKELAGPGQSGWTMLRLRPNLTYRSLMDYTKDGVRYGSVQEGTWRLQGGLVVLSGGGEIGASEVNLGDYSRDTFVSVGSAALALGLSVVTALILSLVALNRYRSAVKQMMSPHAIPAGRR